VTIPEPPVNGVDREVLIVPREVDPLINSPNGELANVQVREAVIRKVMDLADWSPRGMVIEDGLGVIVASAI
jgi:hypothetical protein